MKRQWANNRTRPPIEGARIGAAPITSISRDIRMAAAWPSARSRTTARGITMLAEPPKAATARKTASQAIDGASAQPMQASVNRPCRRSAAAGGRNGRTAALGDLTESEAGEPGRQRELRGARGAAEGGFDGGEGGQVHVGGGGAHGDEQAEQRWQPGGRFHPQGCDRARGGDQWPISPAPGLPARGFRPSTARLKRSTCTKHR